MTVHTINLEQQEVITVERAEFFHRYTAFLIDDVEYWIIEQIDATHLRVAQTGRTAGDLARTW